MRKGILIMRIAVSTENGMIFQHFGKTETFTLYETEGREIKSKRLLSSGGSGHSALVVLLRENGVNQLICGGIGGGAKDALSSAGIGLTAGASGSADAAVNLYLEGKLIHNDSLTCSHHHGHEDGHTCGEHGCGRNGSPDIM